MNKKILGIGNAIVDVLAKVDDEFLIKKNFIKGSYAKNGWRKKFNN